MGERRWGNDAFLPGAGFSHAVSEAMPVPTDRGTATTRALARCGALAEGYPSSWPIRGLLPDERPKPRGSSPLG
jgi:hypothetical protein